MKKVNKNLSVAVLFCLTIICSLLVYFVDRKPVGFDGSYIGFSTLNRAFADSFGYNAACDKISDIAMGLAFLVVAFFAGMGLVQLIREKSLTKVNKAIIGLGVLYVVVVILYVAFDKIPINYRPLIQPGETEIEASFPSTHTLVICTVLGSAILAWNKLLSNKKIAKALQIVALAVIVIGIIARLFAGVHWVTDILAGILFSMTLVSAYAAWGLE